METNPNSEDDEELSRGGMCDTACQTRESLFQPGFKVNPTPSQQPRFSTFGYDSVQSQTDPTTNNPPLTKQASSKPTAKTKRTVATTIEMEDVGIAIPPIPITEIPQHKHQHHSHQHHQHHIHHDHKKQPKIEESRIVLDIRNSAPDVIIMTSSH